MRKERLIVPVLVALLLLWLVGQAVSSELFEREMTRALDDLEARGELTVERDRVESGWWASTGRIQVAPLLGDAWRVELTYEANHGVLSTHLDGEVVLRHGPDGTRLFGDSLPSSPPRWKASYHTLTGTLEAGIRLSPFRITQQDRELRFDGGRLDFTGEYGNWQLQARLNAWRLIDGDARLEVGPATLESRYAYTQGARAFTQEDRLRIESLAWEQPGLSLEASELVLADRMILDERELRVRVDLDLAEVRTADAQAPLLTGGLEAELSRLHAGALRASVAELRELAASGEHLAGEEILAQLEPRLLAVLQDSPRLDLMSLELQSPMMNLAAHLDGALFFDARRLDELSLVALDEPAMQARWRERLDGDFTWYDVPTVVALWLGLPLDTDTLEIDVGRGQVRVNGRPLPPRWR